MALDGVDSTYWCTPGNTETAVLTLDLGSTVAISGIQIRWNYFSDDFVIAVSSDGSSWEDLATGSASSRGELSNIPTIEASAQYVRITANSGDTYSGQPIIGIYELMVHSCTAPTTCGASSLD